jgi:ankyrin repeat protein
VARALLGAGADPHIVDRDGQMSLAIAVEEGHAECVAVLEVCVVD